MENETIEALEKLVKIKDETIKELERQLQLAKESIYKVAIADQPHYPYTPTYPNPNLINVPFVTPIQPPFIVTCSGGSVSAALTGSPLPHGSVQMGSVRSNDTKYTVNN